MDLAKLAGGRYHLHLVDIAAILPVELDVDDLAAEAAANLRENVGERPRAPFLECAPGALVVAPVVARVGGAVAGNRERERKCECSSV
jgi:hypothetical protein